MKYILPILLLFSFCGHAADLKLESVLSHLSSDSTSNDSNLTLDENLHNGKVLKLSNGTLWEVAPQDVEITEIWIFPFPLKLGKSGNKAYPYYLQNLRSKTKVLVRPLSKAEEQEIVAPQQKQPQSPPTQQTPPPAQSCKPAPPPPPTSLEN